MKRTTKIKSKGPSVRSLIKANNVLQDQNITLYERLTGAQQIEPVSFIRTEAASDSAVSAAVKAATSLGFRVYISLDFQNRLQYTAEKHTRA